jgi:methionyl-tRNA synthetase
MLKAAGIPVYRHLNVHGYWNVEASKMSKSLGNVIRPLQLVEKYGLDAFRYFLLREMVFGLDASFSEVALVQRLNADLANDLGNLLQRSLTMAKKYCQGLVPSSNGGEELERELREKAMEVVAVYPREMAELGAHKAMVAVWDLIGLANRYIDRTEPFRLAKDPDRRERLDTVMYHVLEVNRILSLLLWPLMPKTAEEMSRQLGTDPPGKSGDLPDRGKWGLLRTGSPLGSPKPLFPRVDVEKAGLAISGKPEKPREGEGEHPAEITIEEFKRVELRAARVQAAESLKGSDRLLRLRVELGGEERTLVAGIAKHYRPEELVGKMVIVVANLKPAKIFGQTSQGMVLAVAGEEGVRLLGVDGKVESGTRVT